MKKIVLSVLLIFLLSACQSNTDPETAPEIILNGTSIVNLEVGDTYEDAGAYIDSDEEYTLNVANLVDTETPGQYTVTYYYTYEGNTILKVRTVNVEDDFPVTFYLLGDETVTIEIGDNYTDPGIFISDVSVPVDVTDNVDISTVGTYTITFSITVNGQTRSIYRTLEVIQRLVTLNGDTTMTIALNTVWEDVDPGYTLRETGVNVQVDASELDTSVAGTYAVYYRYYDDGSLFTLTRTVIVE